MRRLAYLLLAITVIGVLVWMLRYPGLLPEELRRFVEAHYAIIQVVVALVLGASVVELISSMVTSKIKHLGAEAYLIRNVVLLAGYVVVGVVVLAILGVSGESLLAGATFTGLVIGLGLQPVLANLFAGLIILGSGFVKPGSRVRIGGTGLPVSTIAFPAYKAFSLDFVVPALKGIVIEVGLMYTKVLLDSGELVKIPNSTLFSGSIVIEEAEEEVKKFQVRYELPIDCDPAQALERIKSSLKDLGDFKVLIEEQSDKNYYIVLVVGTAPPGTKLREFRSQVLAKIIQAHREMKTSGLCASR